MTRLYRLALRAFPRRHRDLYGVEMVDAFDRELTARAGRARLSFGCAACLNAIGTGLVERQRQRRIRQGPAFSALDFTLAWRMLRRDPGLSLVSVLGMSVGITIAAGAITIASMMMATTLPLPGGGSPRLARELGCLEAWRHATSVEDLSVSRDVQRNLIVDGRAPEVVLVAEISASAFRAARVDAARGRTLVPDDERAGGPDVLVIGHDEWVRRFGADPDIVGQSVGLGPTMYTIVGVMPEAGGSAVPGRASSQDRSPSCRRSIGSATRRRGSERRRPSRCFTCTGRTRATSCSSSWNARGKSASSPR